MTGGRNWALHKYGRENLFRNVDWWLRILAEASTFRAGEKVFRCPFVVENNGVGIEFFICFPLYPFLDCLRLYPPLTLPFPDLIAEIPLPKNGFQEPLAETPVHLEGLDPPDPGIFPGRISNKIELILGLILGDGSWASRRFDSPVQCPQVRSPILEFESPVWSHVARVCRDQTRKSGEFRPSAEIRERMERKGAKLFNAEWLFDSEWSFDAEW